MDFIMVPLIVGTVTFGIYKLFELFARRKERLSIIEKMGEKFDASMVEGKFEFPIKNLRNSPYGTLKVACLLLGIGLGLLVGFFIALNTIGIQQDGNNWNNRETTSVIYGASVLLFGGLGLVVAFLVEIKNHTKSE